MDKLPIITEYCIWNHKPSVHIPNEETLEAFEEVEEMKRNPDLYKGYTDVDEMMKDLLGE